jgi:hypothetical protein
MFSDNLDFRGVTPIIPTVTMEGQLPIGTGASPAIEIGVLTSPDASITIAYNNPNIELTAGSAMATTYTTDAGSAVPAANILNVLGGNGIDTAGAGNTITIAVDGSIVGQTITGDTGGALSPTAGNWNILGGPGVTTTGSGSTLTINSVVYTDQGGSTSVASDSGSFSTAAITLTLPASPADGERCEFIASTADQLVIQAAGTQIIHLGNVATSAGGTATNSAIGDAMSLIYQESTDDWWALNAVGIWVLA